MEKRNEDELLTEIRKQNSDSAFRELYYQCYNRFFHIAYYYLQKDEWAQEVVLDVFLGIWNNRSMLNDVRNFSNYSFILIKNASMNFLEKENKRSTSTLDSITEPISSISSPEEKLIDDELFQCYIDAVDALPEKCREIFLLIREEKKSYLQVAELFNISPKTVDAQLQKAVSKLKEKINAFILDSK